ncbi:MAG: discoidin domain-containing protein [Pseudomonadota bacterium]
MKKQMALNSSKALSTLVDICFWLVSLASRNPNFAVALLFTALFYLPSLRASSIDAGFLYTGDILGWYLPALAKTFSLFSTMNFTAIDFSTFHGSSDYFLSPNFFAYHPLVVIGSLLAFNTAPSTKDIGHALVWLLALHSFISFYFCLKLFQRFFRRSLIVSTLIAAMYAFGVYTVSGLAQPPYLLCSTVVCWVACSALSYAEETNFKNFVFACLPVIFALLGGYVPIGAACLALSIGLIATSIWAFSLPDQSPRMLVARFIKATLPFFGAGIVVLPFLVAVYLFHSETTSFGTTSLFYSAHQLTEPPHGILRALTTHLNVPGAAYEFSIYWGLIPSTIAAIFFLDAGTSRGFSRQEWILFSTAGFAYFATVLAIFGTYSPLSDLVYYLVPQVGKMHIYQRFLMPAQLLLALMTALMLSAIIRRRPLKLCRVFLIFWIVVTLVVSFFVAYSPASAERLGFNGSIVFELIVVVLFICALLVPRRCFTFTAAIILISLPSFNMMYEYSRGTNSFIQASKTKPISLDDKTRNDIVRYFKDRSEKKIIKYVDITPMWTTGRNGPVIETFPKVFPYFVLNEVKLSSYGGFTFYLSSRAEYMKRMPVGAEVVVMPDWDLVFQSGADFLVARESDTNRATLRSMLSKVSPKDVLRLPNSVVVFPLPKIVNSSLASAGNVFDNGYFKIFPTEAFRPLKLKNIALNKPATQSSTAYDGLASRAVDENTNGDFTLYSVTHTATERNAWLQIDLGTSQSIDMINVWNRTDCCADRLRDFWVFVSDQPFGQDDTAAMLKEKSGVWARAGFRPNPKSSVQTGGIRGRYVRIQLPGNQPIEDSSLSIAEVEVMQSADSTDIPLPLEKNADAVLSVPEFISNDANYMRFVVESKAPTTAQYLFWPNPRLTYLLNGDKVGAFEQDGLPTFNFPPGRNIFEVRYQNRPLMIFWVFYTAYFTALLIALIGWFCKKLSEWRPNHNMYSQTHLQVDNELNESASVIEKEQEKKDDAAAS